MKKLQHALEAARAEHDKFVVVSPVALLQVEGRSQKDKDRFFQDLELECAHLNDRLEISCLPFQRSSGESGRQSRENSTEMEDDTGFDSEEDEGDKEMEGEEEEINFEQKFSEFDNCRYRRDQSMYSSEQLSHSTDSPNIPEDEDEFAIDSLKRFLQPRPLHDFTNDDIGTRMPKTGTYRTLIRAPDIPLGCPELEPTVMYEAADDAGNAPGRAYKPLKHPVTVFDANSREPNWSKWRERFLIGIDETVLNSDSRHALPSNLFAPTSGGWTLGMNNKGEKQCWKDEDQVQDQGQCVQDSNDDAALSSSLNFESRFESGNLLSAIRVDDMTYDLVLRPDFYTSGHTQWYYFAVQRPEEEEKSEAKLFTFRIINMNKAESLYKRGLLPLVNSSLRKKGWERRGANVQYFENNKRQGKKRGHTLSFCLEIEAGEIW
eukprot:766328-Hanusia_phi.AAC.13